MKYIIKYVIVLLFSSWAGDESKVIEFILLVVK